MEPAWDHEALWAWFSPRAGEDVLETELLRTFFPDDPFAGGMGLELFQKHFLLYRRLWLFDDQLRLTTGHRLWIRGIRSTLLDPPAPGSCGWLDLETGSYCVTASELCPQHSQALHLPEKNSMKSYYLDWKNLEGMTEDGLKKLVDDFFNWMGNQGAVSRALETFGLPVDASAAAIKARWRRLSLEHHPDRGGNASLYQELSAAWATLKFLK